MHRDNRAKTVKGRVEIIQEFRHKYALDLEDPVTKKFSIIRALGKALEVNAVAVYSMLLQVWLARLGVPPPKGVFQIDLQATGPGRPPMMEEAYRVWLAYGSMPKPTFPKVARKLYPSEYGDHPKATADRVRQLYVGHAKRLWAEAMQSVWPSPEQAGSK